MDAAQFDEFLQSIQKQETWLHFGELAGNSDKIDGFVNEVKAASCKFQQSLGPGLVHVFRRGTSQRVDQALINALGFSDARKIQFNNGAHAHNAIQLFGSGLRPGCMEPEVHKIVLIDSDFVEPDLQERFCRSLRNWIAEGSKRILFLDQTEQFPMKIDFTIETTSIALTPLKDRREDIPYVVHLSAARHNGGLDKFSVTSINRIIDSDWPMDLSQVDRFVRMLFTNSLREGLFLDEDVETCLQHSKKYSVNVQPKNIQSVWIQLKTECEEIDRLAISLVGVTFFASGTAKMQSTPIGSSSPEFDFFRLVSWAYAKYVEDAEPNFRCVLKLSGGLNVNSELLTEVRDQIIALRTFFQHSIQFSTDHGQKTLELAAGWFELAIDRRFPEEEDHENCIRKLLSQLHSITASIKLFLRRLNDDEFRGTIIKQWKDRTLTTWPKYKFEKLMAEAIHAQSRYDLDAQSVCKILLSRLQDKLTTLKDDPSRETVITAFMERELEEMFPPELPITGQDLVDLGCEKGPRIGRLLKELRLHFDKRFVDRAEAISFAKHLIATAKNADL